jgi:hypothetical protein
MGDEYPTDEELDQIKAWPYEGDAHLRLWEFIHSLWHWPEWGFRHEGTAYYLSTGGWSGNESIIGAMQSNFMFWPMWWQSSRRGGHYTFKHVNDKADIEE